MSLFTRAVNPLERRSTPSPWMVPPPSDGVSQDPRTADAALRHSTVWGCISLIAETLGSMPIDVYRKGPDGVNYEVDAPMIVTDPSPTIDPISWRTQFVSSLLAHGNSYGLISHMGANGWPDEIEWLDPSTVRPQWGKNNRLEFITPFGVFTKSEIVHTPGLVVPGNPIGMSPIRHFAQTIGVGLSAQAFGAKWFADGAHPSAIIYSEHEQDEVSAKQIKASFMRAVTGREPAVMGAGLKYEQVSVPANESQFLEAIGANAAIIAGQIFRVPPEMLGISSQGKSITYANREQHAVDFLTFTLLPWITRFERMMSAQLPNKQFVKLNVGALLRSDTKTASEVAAIDLTNRIRTQNEVRLKFDLPPVPGGNEFSPIGGNNNA